MIEDKETMALLLDNGLLRSDFVQDELRVFDFLVNYIEKYDVMPGLQTIEVELGVKFQKIPDNPMEYWIDQLKLRSEQSRIVSAIRSLDDFLKENKVEEALAYLRDTVADLDQRSLGEHLVDIRHAFREVIRWHKKRQLMPDLGGVPFGFPFLDIVSDGAQKGDSIAVVGRPGTGKTYMLLKIMLSAFNEGFSPLIVTTEMPIVQCARRLLAMMTHTPANMLRFGRVTAFVHKRFDELLEELQKNPEHRFYFMQGSLNTTVEDIALMIRDARPTVVGIDGAYMLRMRTDASAKWERVTSIAEATKSMAVEFDIPIVSTYQFNRRGPGSLGNIAFSDAVGQLASIVIGVQFDSDIEEDAISTWEPKHFRILELLKGREGERGTLRVSYDLHNMIIKQTEILNDGGFRISPEQFAEAQRRYPAENEEEQKSGP
jgi:replicative DNA helicase